MKRALDSQSARRRPMRSCSKSAAGAGSIVLRLVAQQPDLARWFLTTYLKLTKLLHICEYNMSVLLLIAKLSFFKSLTRDDQWAFLDALVKGNKPIRPYFPPATITRCKPLCAGKLYVNIPFPCFKTTSSNLYVDDECIFNGHLSEHDKTDDVEMDWYGYVSQNYDGELKLSPVHGYKDPHIQGVCNGVKFEFRGTELVYGVWPGFLCLYDLKE